MSVVEKDVRTGNEMMERICCNCEFIFYRSERSVNNYGASNYGCECLNENNEIHGRGIFVHSTDTCKYFKSKEKMKWTNN